VQEDPPKLKSFNGARDPQSLAYNLQVVGKPATKDIIVLMT